MKQSNQTTDAIIYSLLYVVIFMLSVFLPFFILIGIILMPVPIIVYTAKYNSRSGIVITLLLAVFAFLIGTYIALSIVVFTCLGGLMIGHMIHKKASPYETLLYGTVGYAIGLVFAYACSHLFLDINWLDMFNESMDQSIETFTSFITQLGLDTDIEAQLKIIEQQITQITYSFTAILIIIGACMSLFTQWIAYKWMNWRQQTKYFFPPFRSFNFPVILIWIHLIVIIVQYMGLEEGSLPYIAVINIYVLTTMCIIIQGYSFIFHFAYVKKIHMIVPIIVLVLSLIFAPIFLIFIRFIGIIDIGFRWKSRIQRK